MQNRRETTIGQPNEQYETLYFVDTLSLHPLRLYIKDGSKKSLECKCAFLNVQQGRMVAKQGHIIHMSLRKHCFCSFTQFYFYLLIC